MAIEQPVDEMEIPGTATSSADGESAGELRFGARRKSGYFLMPDMDPFDLALLANRVGNSVQPVANDAVDALDAGRGERLRELFCNCAHRLDRPFTPFDVLFLYSHGASFNSD